MEAPQGSRRMYAAFMDKGDMEIVVTIPRAPIREDPDPACDDVVRLHCHSTLLKLASPLMEDLLESCSDGSHAGPGAGTGVLSVKVDGPAEAWHDILSHLYCAFIPFLPAISSKRPAKSPAALAAACTADSPQTGSPPQTGSGSGSSPQTGSACGSPPLSQLEAAAVPTFSWQSVSRMLPVLHKYSMQALLDRVVAWVETQAMSGEPSSPAYLMHWLELAQTLQLESLEDVCQAQLSQMPLSLSPDSSGYVMHWLQLADEKSLTELKARCLAFLNTGAASGQGSGPHISLKPESSRGVMKLLRLVHGTGHCGELQPLRKKCIATIQKAAADGKLCTPGGSSMVDAAVADVHAAPEPARPASAGSSALVRELLSPVIALSSNGTMSGRQLEVPAGPAAVATDGMQQATVASNENGAAAGEGASTSFSVVEMSARVDGLSALAEGLLMRNSNLEQVTSSMVPASTLYSCNNCGHAVAVFKNKRLERKPLVTWLKVVSTQSFATACPACGNTSLVSQSSPKECKVLWAGD